MKALFVVLAVMALSSCSAGDDAEKSEKGSASLSRTMVEPARPSPAKQKVARDGSEDPGEKKPFEAFDRRLKEMRFTPDDAGIRRAAGLGEEK